MKNNKVVIEFDNLELLSFEELKDLKSMVMKSYGMGCIDEKVMEGSYWRLDKMIGEIVFKNWKNNMDEGLYVENWKMG
tara:strand:- start:1109 stop:1342 length:234 start_codon:yes stop_codon:yes gene_type:complete